MVIIVPFSDENEQVIGLLIELQKHLVSIDSERVQTLNQEYGELYFNYVLRLIEENCGIILVAVEDKEVVGMVAGYIEPKDEEDHITNRCLKRGVVSELVVSERFRSNGIGRELMNAIESYFSSQDCEFVSVDVFGPNKAAQDFYGSLGYLPRNIELYKKLG